MKASIAANLPVGLEEDILKSLRVPLAVIDNEFRYIWLNREMARIFQTRPEQVTGKVCYEMLSKQAGPCQDCPVAAVQKSGRKETFQKYKSFPDSGRKYGEVTAFPIFGRPKRVVATLMMVIDITDKIVVDLGTTYQMLARLSGASQGSMSAPLISLERQRIKRGSGQDRAVISNLTRRETQVLLLLSKGHSNTQIAACLGISPHTVKSYVTSVFNKLGVNDRIQAAVVAIRQGIVQ